MPTEDDAVPHERRRYRRFSVEFNLQYRLGSAAQGTGAVVNMSSGGLLFRGSERLPLGELIEADVFWPFKLDDATPLLVRVRGMVVRSDPNGTAISISRYEFRTRGA